MVTVSCYCRLYSLSLASGPSSTKPYAVSRVCCLEITYRGVLAGAKGWFAVRGLKIHRFTRGGEVLAFLNWLDLHSFASLRCSLAVNCQLSDTYLLEGQRWPELKANPVGGVTYRYCARRSCY